MSIATEVKVLAEKLIDELKAEGLAVEHAAELAYSTLHDVIDAARHAAIVPPVVDAPVEVPSPADVAVEAPADEAPVEASVVDTAAPEVSA